MVISYERITTYYILLLILGGALVGVLANIIGISGTWGIRVVNSFVFLMGIFLIIKYPLRGLRLIRFKFVFVVYIFLFLLSMISQLFFKDIYTDTFSNKGQYFIYLFFYCMFPAYVIISLRQLDVDKLFYYLYNALFLFLVISIFYNSVFKLDSASLLRNHGAQNVGALTYGHFGASLVLMSLTGFSRKEAWNNGIKFIIGIGLGLLTIILASSRSPFVVLLACVVFYILFVKREKFIWVFVTVSLSILYFFRSNIQNIFFNFHTSFFDRLNSLIVDRDVSGRDVILKEAVKQIENNELIGGTILIESGTFEGFYPHNLIVESLMATGIIGTVCFIFIVFYVFRKGFQISIDNKKNEWVLLIFLQYLLFGMVSKSLYTNLYLWYFGALIIFISNNKYLYLSKK